MPQFILVSFCNIHEFTTSPILCVKIPFAGQDLVEYASVDLGYPGLIHHVTGLTIAGDKILAVFLSEGKFFLAGLNQHDLMPLFYQELPEAGDIHSILALSDQLYVVSTGTDEILVYDILQTGVANSQVFWRATSEQKDTHHVNSIVENEGELFISAFGVKAGNLWSSAPNGYIHNISRDTRTKEGIYHPHSLSARNGQLYYCESHKGTFCSLDNPILHLPGYSRGVSWLSNDEVCLATSVGRKVSRSTNQIGNAADPGIPIGQCGLTVQNIKNGKILATADLSWFGPEIYDTLVLPEQQIDLLKIATSAQMAERRVIQTLLHQKPQSAQTLSAQIDEKQQSVQMLLAQVAEKQQSVQILSAQVTKNEQTVEALTTQLSEMYGSKDWHFVMLLRKIRAILAHPIRGLTPLFMKDKKIEDDTVLLISSSGLFDGAWYLNHNPDVAQAKVDPLLHYLYKGGYEGRDPGPNFSSAWYLDTYEDVKKARINPLVHYLKHGQGEGRAAQPKSIGTINPS